MEKGARERDALTFAARYLTYKAVAAAFESEVVEQMKGLFSEWIGKTKKRTEEGEPVESSAQDIIKNGAAFGEEKVLKEDADVGTKVARSTPCIAIPGFVGTV